MAVAAEVPVVPDDATLDAFARDGPAGERDEASDGEDGSGKSTDVAVPAVTSSWAEAGACEACGERAARRWVDDGERVCGTCKQWS